MLKVAPPRELLRGATGNCNIAPHGRGNA